MSFKYFMGISNGDNNIDVEFKKIDNSNDIVLVVRKEKDGNMETIVSIKWTINTGNMTLDTDLRNQSITTDPLGDCIALCVAGKVAGPFVYCLIKERDPWKCIDKYSIKGWGSIIECVLTCLGGGA